MKGLPSLRRAQEHRFLTTSLRDAGAAAPVLGNLRSRPPPLSRASYGFGIEAPPPPEKSCLISVEISFIPRAGLLCQAAVSSASPVSHTASKPYTKSENLAHGTRPFFCYT